WGAVVVPGVGPPARRRDPRRARERDGRLGRSPGGRRPGRRPSGACANRAGRPRHGRERSVGRQHYNGLKTAGLFGLMWAIVLGLWALFGARANLLWLFVGIGLVATFYGYWDSDKIAIRAMHARPVSELEQPAMYRHVRELRGVLGHELMHVYNRDILTSSVAGALAGVITSLAQFLLIFGGDRDRGGNPVAALAMVVLAPLAAMLVQLAISRTREYDADEDGARLTGDPLALASALRKLDAGTQRAPLPQN